jgi:hypothetical protein
LSEASFRKTKQGNSRIILAFLFIKINKLILRILKNCILFLTSCMQCCRNMTREYLIGSQSSLWKYNLLLHYTAPNHTSSKDSPTVFFLFLFFSLKLLISIVRVSYETKIFVFVCSRSFAKILFAFCEKEKKRRKLRNLSQN